MNQTSPPDPRDPAFLKIVSTIQSRIGRIALSDEDLMRLAVEEISRTFTREEKHYDA
jgi:hypothetical protein